MTKPTPEYDPVMLEKWRLANNNTTSGNIPLWVKKPAILNAVVEDVLKLGRLDLATENNRVGLERVKRWVAQGKKEFDAQGDAADYDETTPLGRFYLDVSFAESMFISGRIETMLRLADSNDPAMMQIYANFHKWLLTHIDVQKRFAPNLTMNTKTDVNHSGTIRVTYANGDAWRLGGQVVDVIEGDVVDTEMKQIGPAPEDF